MEQDIFKKSSSTYYWASKLFPTNVRDDVFDLYSFVRLADDYVDQMPSDIDGFYRLRRMWLESSGSIIFSTKKSPDDTPDERAIKNIVRLHHEQGIKKQWVEDFLNAMQSDIVFRPKETLDDALRYTHGSAEVVGLMMCKILDLPISAQETASMQGRAMQWLNFIRDVSEDNQLSRQYFPVEDLKKFKLNDLFEQTALSQPDDFKQFMQFQIDRYRQWQQDAETGYRYLPKRLLIPIKTAAWAYSWTADQIEKDPFVVFRKKVRPAKHRILWRMLTVVGK